MRAQLSVLFRDVIGAIFRENGTDFHRLTLRMDLRHGVDWRAIGEGNQKGKIKASVPLACKNLSAHCYLPAMRLFAVWAFSHIVSFSTP